MVHLICFFLITFLTYLQHNIIFKNIKNTFVLCYTVNSMFMRQINWLLRPITKGCTKGSDTKGLWALNTAVCVVVMCISGEFGGVSLCACKQ